jgi:protein SCO1/2
MSALVLLALAANPLAAQRDWPPPTAVAGVSVVENLNESVPLDAPFTDHDGRTVTLRKLLDGVHPVVVTPVYYGCSTLCPVVLRGVVGALKATGLSLDDDYRVVTFSIDPSETSAQADQTRTELMHGLGYASGHLGWSFLVGPATSITPLTDALGFHYAYDAQLKQFAHGAAFMVLTPDGRISRYLYGVQYPSRDVRLALVEASNGHVGTTFDRVMLTCFRFDPATRRYQLYVQGLLKGGGLLAFLFVAGLLFKLWRRELRPA